jgi:hypothetical protein
MHMNLLPVLAFVLAFLVRPDTVYAHSAHMAAIDTVEVPAFSVESTTLLPSRVPVDYIHVRMSRLTQAIDQENKDDPPLPTAARAAAESAVTNPGNWRLWVRRGKMTFAAPRPGTRAWVVQGSATSDPSVGYLILRAGVLQKGDSIRVGVMRGGTLYVHPEWLAITRLNAPRPITLQFDPKQVPDQKLLGGGQSNVIQFGLNVDVPSMLGDAGPARVYFTTKTLLSTDERDVATRIQPTLGFEFSPLRAWHVPVFGEVSYQANQAFSNTSVIASGGLRTIIPWAWTRSFLWTDAVRAPVSPEIAVGAEFQRRLKVDSLVAHPSAKDNLVRYAARFDWAPVYVLPGRTADFKDIVLQPSLRGWYFPSNDSRGGTGIREFEGRADLSLFVPISGYPALEFLTGASSAEGTLTRLKVQFVSGANEANGFKRSVEWKIGFEVTK